MEIINSAIEFLQKVKSTNVVTIKFEKKDGTLRTMRCTLDFSRIPKSKHPQDVNLPNILKLLHDKGILRVYDVEKEDWRSVPYLRVEWLSADNVLYQIQHLKH